MGSLNEFGLTKKQEDFCQFYALTFNASQSAIDSGYSKKTAFVIGHENLSKPRIQERLKTLLAPKEAEGKRRIADIHERNEILTDIARSTELNYKGMKEVSDSDKIKALDILNKVEGVYIEKKQISGSGGGDLTATIKFIPV